MSLLPSLHSLSNSTTINDLLYLDTSFIWESFGTTNGNIPHRQVECHNFSTQAVKDQSIFVTSPIIEDELRNVALKELLKTHSVTLGLKPHNRKAIISSVPNIMNQVHNQVDTIMQILDSDPNFVILPEDGERKLAHKLSSLYNMDLNDSIILATMISNEIDSIVTLDGDYVSVHDKGLHIYTNHSNYLKLLNKHTGKLANGNNQTNLPGSTNSTNNTGTT